MATNKNYFLRKGVIMNPKILTKRPWLRRFPILVYLLIICMAICAGCGFSSAGTLETGFTKM